jgi:protein phosphatase
LNLFRFLNRKKTTAPAEPVPPSNGYQIQAALQTDIGCTRQENQDYGIIVQNEAAQSRGVLIAVADGMGGHKGGQVASRCAIEELVGSYYAGVGTPQADLESALEDANRAVYQKAQEFEDLEGMGSTCTALVLADNMAHCAHVGDSRIYLIRDGAIQQITEDHSAVMQLVREGVLSLEEARHHAERNVITRAIGSRPEVEVYTWHEPLPLRSGDRFVVCSDGLHGRMDDSEILSIAGSKDPHRACAALVQLARQRGGYDNITVAIAYLKPASNPA